MLEDQITQSITVVDTATCLVSVSAAFPPSHVIRWEMQGHPAWVVADGPLYRIESDLVLASGQALTCVVGVTGPAVIHDRLFKLWSPRWNRHVHVPPDRWRDILAVAESLLPVEVFDLPPVTINDWRFAASQFRPNAAAGPCGWNRSDLLHLSDSDVQQVLEFFQSIEQGAEWPIQMTSGLVHLLQKKTSSVAVNEFRPINVCSKYVLSRLCRHQSRTDAFPARSSRCRFSMWFHDSSTTGRPVVFHQHWS